MPPRPVSAPAGALRIAMQVMTLPRVSVTDRERRRRRAGAPVLAVTSLAYVAAGMAVLCWAMR
jgi:hypothetical protein